jgi:hypothetical protein
MNLAFNRIISKSILDMHNLTKINNDDIYNFIDQQILALPDYTRFFLSIIANTFNYFFVILYFRSFINLSSQKRISILRILKRNKIPVFNLMLKFYEHSILLIAIENQNESTL